MSKVNVVADTNGNIVGISERNPEYGFVRVQQVASEINNEGWLRMCKRFALIKGKVEDLVGMNYIENQEIVGKIVVVESLTPFNAANPEKDYKMAGLTGVICRVDDQPIYRQSFFTSNVESEDIFIQHDNKEEIKDVQAAQKGLSGLSEGLKMRVLSETTL